VASLRPNCLDAWASVLPGCCATEGEELVTASAGAGSRAPELARAVEGGLGLGAGAGGAFAIAVSAWSKRGARRARVQLPWPARSPSLRAPPQNTYERGAPPASRLDHHQKRCRVHRRRTHAPPAEATPGSPRVFGWRWELRRRSTPRADAPCGASARKPPTSRPPFLAAKLLVAAGRKPAPRGKREPRRPPDQPLRLPDWNDLDSPGAHLRRSWLVAKSATPSRLLLRLRRRCTPLSTLVQRPSEIDNGTVQKLWA
jgi:hypothetical protein